MIPKKDYNTSLYGFKESLDKDNWVIEPLYNGVNTLQNGFFIVHVKDENWNYKYGLVDPNGEEIFTATHKYISCLKDEEGQSINFLYVDYNGEINIYDFNKNKVTDTTFNSLSIDVTSSLRPFEIRGRYGYLDNQFEQKIRAQYEIVDLFKEGLGRVRQSKKFGFVNEEGIDVIKCQYDDAENFSESRALVKNKPENLNDLHWNYRKVDTFFGFIDMEGKTVIPLGKYIYASSFSEGLAAVGIRKGFWGKPLHGYIDKYGRTKIEFQYEAVGKFENGLATVQINREGFKINKKGEIVNKIDRYVPW